jgi:hypothetical protein
MNAIICPEFSLVMKEVLCSIVIDEVAGESRDNTTYYPKCSGDEINGKLLPITFDVTLK